MTMSLDVNPVRGDPGCAVSGQSREYRVEVRTQYYCEFPWDHACRAFNHIRKLPGPRTSFYGHKVSRSVGNDQ